MSALRSSGVAWQNEMFHPPRGDPEKGPHSGPPIPSLCDPGHSILPLGASVSSSGKWGYGPYATRSG